MSSLLVRNPNIYYGGGRRRTTRRRRGRGLFDALKSAHNWIKSNKIISTVGNALSGVPGIGSIAGRVIRRRPVLRLPTGTRMTVRRRVVRRRPLVRQRVVRRRRVGGSLRSILSAAHGFIKKNQL